MKKLEVYLTECNEKLVKDSLWELAQSAIQFKCSVMFYYSLSALAPLLDLVTFELGKEVLDAVYNGKKLDREAFDKMVVFKKGANDE